MICLRLIVGIALTIPVSGVANAESIKSALARAYKHNAELNAQRAATRVADEALPQALSGYRPTLDADANFGFTNTRNKIGGVVGTTSTNTNPYGYGINLRQSIFNGFRTVNGVAAAEASIRASREQLRRVEQVVLQNAATAYVNVLVSREQVSIRNQNLRFLTEQLNSSRARLDVGEGTRTDVAQSQAQHAAAQSAVSAAKAQLSGAESIYFQLIGKRPSGLVWPRTGPSSLYPSGMNSAISLGVSNHPAVRLAQYSVDASAFNVKVQEGAYLPSLGLVGRAERNFNNGNDGNRLRNLGARLELSVPIYQGGTVSSQVRESKESLAQARIEVDVARDQVRAAVVTAWSQLQAAKANVIANRQQVKAAKLAVSGVVEERNVGQRTQLDVLTQQSQLLSAELSLLTARQTEIDAGYALVSSVGRLNSRQLRLNVQHYLPEDHYEKVKDLWFGLRTPTGR